MKHLRSPKEKNFKNAKTWASPGERPASSCYSKAHNSSQGPSTCRELPNSSLVFLYVCVLYNLYLCHLYHWYLYHLYLYHLHLFIYTTRELRKASNTWKKKKKAWKLYREKKISENLLILSGISKKQLHPWNKML